ncbi:hypothetical protein JTB14_013140 [Gonioctena quinquepunctata]|nr:hypothetical protein JTB14_013140 [Gonioctena quinquepunctata]
MKKQEATKQVVENVKELTEQIEILNNKTETNAVSETSNAGGIAVLPSTSSASNKSANTVSSKANKALKVEQAKNSY